MVVGLIWVQRYPGVVVVVLDQVVLFFRRHFPKCVSVTQKQNSLENSTTQHPATTKSTRQRASVGWIKFRLARCSSSRCCLSRPPSTGGAATGSYLVDWHSSPTKVSGAEQGRHPNRETWRRRGGDGGEQTSRVLDSGRRWRWSYEGAFDGAAPSRLTRAATRCLARRLPRPEPAPSPATPPSKFNFRVRVAHHPPAASRQGA